MSGKEEELDEKIIAYIHSLSKRELEDTLYDILYSGESWVFDKFRPRAHRLSTAGRSEPVRGVHAVLPSTFSNPT